MVEYFVAIAGLKINSTDEDGFTPLHYACKRNISGEIISYLGELMYMS